MRDDLALVIPTRKGWLVRILIENCLMGRILVLSFVISIGFITRVEAQSGHSFDGDYKGANLDRIAFPIGGIGAGMFCLEGTGALSHVSMHHHPEMFNEPKMFAALYVKG